MSGAEISVEVSPPVLLLSVVCSLADYQEYNAAVHPDYHRSMREFFKGCQDHPAVRMARSLRRKASISWNAPLALAVFLQMDSARGVSFRADRTRLPSVDKRWQFVDVPGFVALLDAFFRGSGFQEFMMAQNTFHARAVAEMQAMLRRSALSSWLLDFFQPTAKIRFLLVFDPLVGPYDYGAWVALPDGTDALHCIAGAWNSFDNLTGIIVHEYCHYFINPLVETAAEDLAGAGRKLFSKVKVLMRSRAYGDWKTMIMESIVRACAIRFQASVYGDSVMPSLISGEKSSGFYWIEELVKVIKTYEAERTRYPAFRDFMPKIVEFFRDSSRAQMSDSPRQ